MFLHDKCSLHKATSIKKWFIVSAVTTDANLTKWKENPHIHHINLESLFIVAEKAWPTLIILTKI